MKTDARMSGEAGGMFHYRRKEVLSVLRKMQEGRRYQQIFGIHASNLPFPDIVSGNSWISSRTLRTSNPPSVVTFPRLPRTFLLCIGRIYCDKFFIYIKKKQKIQSTNAFCPIFPPPALLLLPSAPAPLLADILSPAFPI